jgi:hypothetical protein
MDKDLHQSKDVLNKSEFFIRKPFKFFKTDEHFLK